MKQLIFSFVLSGMLAFYYAPHLSAQTSLQTIELKQGEVLDILFLSQHSEVDDALKSYFQTAFPVAKRMSYQPLPGFKVNRHTQGNHHPDILVLGKWKNLERREAFLTEILEEVPDFHERRREIWSYFGLRYFEMKEDLSFTIDRNAYHVATAFWFADNTKPSKFYEKWLQAIGELGGKISLQLREGTSPFGYQYAPDYFLITSWENEAAFKAFQQRVEPVEADNLQQVNEYMLE